MSATGNDSKSHSDKCNFLIFKNFSSSRIIQITKQTPKEQGGIAELLGSLGYKPEVVGLNPSGAKTDG